NYLGGMMEKGEMTQDEQLVGKVVQDICYHNSIAYFRMK
ncbi:MAG: glucuronate isomerase, partial [Clostridia bacterium]|nr:glucuronate isomerase [Clostridia bacterium]